MDIKDKIEKDGGAGSKGLRASAKERVLAALASLKSVRSIPSRLRSSLEARKNSAGSKKSLSSNKNRKPRLSFKIKPLAAVISAAVCFVVILAVIFFVWAASFKHPEKAKPLSREEAAFLTDFLDSTYALNRSENLKPLPYPVVSAELEINAESAILVDAANGCVLYEKNADEVIPPASITKLFVMYIAFSEVDAGNLTLDELVQPPELSWAINMPSDSSLMFLGQGQKVTVRELLTGLAVASGNDAALALAYHISGSTKAFVARMNKEAEDLGLTHTHFEEPSGYSEKNVTTARELAQFCRIYITKYPQSISDYHSKTEIRYPLAANLPPWQASRGDTMAVYQKNTNPLLGTMEGCDGLKTGFIFESGYNLALTCKRGKSRFISITLRGPGQGAKQGNYYRTLDGNTMMDWAFSSFADYNPERHISLSYTIPALGSSEKFIKLVPAWINPITVPNLTRTTAQQSADSVEAVISIPKYVSGETQAGAIYGQIQYKLGSTVLETVPLICDRTLTESNLPSRLLGKLAALTL